MVSKEAYAEWRDSEVTQELYKELAEEVGDCIRSIVERPNANLEVDQRLKGMIAAFSAVVDWSPREYSDAN